MRRGIRWAVTLGLCAAGASLHADRPSLNGVGYDALVQRVLDLTNAERAKYDLQPLKLNARLAAAADWMARDMAQHGYVGHTDSLGRSLAQRVPTFGYNNYAILRENLAGGHESAEEVVDAWMKSPGHRASILCNKSTEIGIAFFQDPTSKHRRYWVQEFGRPLR